jgi:hypothetical protein
MKALTDFLFPEIFFLAICLILIVVGSHETEGTEVQRQATR